jgi:hypothetical protein
VADLEIEPESRVVIESPPNTEQQVTVAESAACEQPAECRRGIAIPVPGRLAGLLHHRRFVEQDQAQPDPLIDPPGSQDLHPVPTRPVFTPRHDPAALELVPAPLPDMPPPVGGLLAPLPQ